VPSPRLYDASTRSIVLAGNVSFHETSLELREQVMQVERKNLVILLDSHSDASKTEENVRGGASTPPPPPPPSPPPQQKKKSPSTHLVLQVETEHGMQTPLKTLKKNVRVKANH
jgi:hypothetical protein